MSHVLSRLLTLHSDSVELMQVIKNTLLTITVGKQGLPYEYLHCVI